ncbi:carcinoembryonic antigen-related cell adhesion molecule 5 [Gadus morhua]|nr:carcinoembryonic antigen-related cell adhesion molecule 5-like [Gadus morhua]
MGTASCGRRYKDRAGVPPGITDGLCHRRFCGIMIRPTARLFLICLAVFPFHPKGIFASEGEHEGAVKDIVPSGPYSMAIEGVNTVTVGVPYAFTCSAKCTPACTFSWRNGNRTSTGAELTLQLKARSPLEILVCVAVNPDTRKSATVSKTLGVTVGPSNIMINGPSMLTLGVENDFTCTADCYPSCTYLWKWMWEGQVLGSSSGATLSIIPPETVNYETLLCEAMDSVSHLFISTSLQRYVARLLGIYIVSPSGQWSVTVGQTFLFTCFVECTPSCTYMWTFEGKTYENDQVHVPVFHKGEKPMIKEQQEITVTQDHRTEPLTCQAKNTVSGATISVTQILTIDNPYSVRPATQGVPMAGQTYSLQCIGSQNPASITWLQNSLPLPVSDRLVLSQDNTLLTFSPLMESDTGTYQCVINVDIGDVKSLGYRMQVNFGPSKVQIVEVNKGAVGKELTALTGSITALQCVADCYPGCSISWFYNGKMLSRNASISFTPVTPPNQAVLRCVAYDPLTMKNSSAETTVIVPFGPFKVEIIEAQQGPVGKELTALAGTITALQCVADCYPACSISWFYNGKMLSRNASISFTPVTPPNQAILRCVAYDPLTMKNSSAETTVIVPFGPSKVQIVEVNKGAVGKELTALAGSITALQCVADCYPACSISWFYNGKMLSRNASISFTPVTPPNQAVLRCVAYDPLTMKNSSAETTVIVPYGPVDVTISGSPSIEVGVKASFTCSATCSPACTYTWTVYGSPVKGSSIDITVSRYVATESISCQAQNSLSGKTATVNDTLTVSEPHWCGC